MALSCYSFPASTAISLSLRPPTSGSRVVMMAAHNQLSVNNSSQIRSLMSRSKNKVFEDAPSGIVCYRDENGEITCEGFDEGPRFHQPLSRFTCNSRDVQIVLLLQRCWDGEALPGRKGI